MPFHEKTSGYAGSRHGCEPQLQTAARSVEKLVKRRATLETDSESLTRRGTYCDSGDHGHHKGFNNGPCAAEKQFEKKDTKIVSIGPEATTPRIGIRRRVIEANRGCYKDAIGASNVISSKRRSHSMRRETYSDNICCAVDIQRSSCAARPLIREVEDDR
ncbi:hypothetical protein AAE478_001623 [Parahypoxylon ruwenzoriense]